MRERRAHADVTRMAIERAHVADPDDGQDVRRRVQRQLFVLAAGAAALLVAMGLVTTWVQARLDKAHHEVAGVAAAQQLNAEVASEHEDLKGALVAALTVRPGDTGAAEDVRAQADEALSSLRVTLREAEAQALPVARTPAARQMRSDDVAFSLRENSLIDLALAGRASAAHVRVLANVDDKLDAQRDTYTRALQQTARHAAKDSARAQGVGHVLVATTAALALAMLAWTFVRIRRSVLGVTRRLQSLLTENENDAARGEFGRQVVEAFDMADDEDAARQVVTRAMTQVSSTMPMELLLADSSKAHLTRAAGHPEKGTPCCPVGTPFECVAVRRGTAVTFEDSEDLHACPKLRDRESGPVSAACVPITFMGRAIGVLHAAGPQGSAPDAETVERLSRLAAHTGSRIGTLRATRQTQLQAATDSLTGLVNRRTLDNEVRELLASGNGFALAFGDLDHFKALNDRYGHDAGDRALRLFSKVLRETTRIDDVVARYGGEEFVVVLPGRSASEAVEAMHRIRARLQEAVGSSDAPSFTVSFGVTDSSMGTTVTDLVRSADSALLAAKSSGRDRVVVAGSPVAPLVPAQAAGPDA